MEPDTGSCGWRCDALEVLSDRQGVPQIRLRERRGEERDTVLGGHGRSGEVRCVEKGTDRMGLALTSGLKKSDLCSTSTSVVPGR